MRLINKVKRVYKAIHAACATLRYGGIGEITIAQLRDENRLNGKHVVVTGGGSGIGFSIAKKSVECGADVIITGRSEKKLKEAVEKIGKENIKYVVWDISDVKVSAQKIKECVEMFGCGIDIFINNAGVQPKKFFPSVDEKEWDEIYSTNSKGTFFICEELCKMWMVEQHQNYKKIINIDSQGGFVGATYPYRMSKWDIRGLTEGLGLSMAPHGIIVNGIAPGVVKTNMQSFSVKQGNNSYCDQNPLSRVALPEEIAELAVYMMSDVCNFIVGQTILIDGGFSLK